MSRHLCRRCRHHDPAHTCRPVRTINAKGLPGAPTGAILGQAPYNGITIESSNVTVEGFKVMGAKGEGILAVNPNPSRVRW